MLTIKSNPRISTQNPKMAVSADIPIIDVNAGDRATVAKQLVDAAEEHGFIYIKNLGEDIPVADIDETFNTVRKVHCQISQVIKRLIQPPSRESFSLLLWRRSKPAPSRQTIADGRRCTARHWIPKPKR